MSNLKTKRIQLGDHATASNNFVIRQPDTPDGSMVISNGTIDSNTDLVTVTSGGNVGVGTTTPRDVSGDGYIGMTIDGSAGGYIDFNSNGLRGGTVFTSAYGGITYDAVNGGDHSFHTDGSTKLIIDNVGRVTTPYQPSFNAYSPAATGQSAYVVYGSTRSNVGGHYSTSTGAFTAPIAGTYHFTYNALMRANTTGAYVRLWFDINGTHDAVYGDTLAGGDTTAFTGWSYLSVTNSMTIYLSANDTVRVWNDGPLATYGVGYGTFTGFLVG